MLVRPAMIANRPDIDKPDFGLLGHGRRRKA
jgi:hypothetical protein